MFALSTIVTLLALAADAVAVIPADRGRKPSDTGFLTIKASRYAEAYPCGGDWGWSPMGEDTLVNNKCKDYGHKPFDRISWTKSYGLFEWKNPDHRQDRADCHVTTYNGSHCSGHGWKYNYQQFQQQCLLPVEQEPMFSIGVTCGGRPLNNIDVQPDASLTKDMSL